MDTIQSDFTVLDKLLAVNLSITLWSARKKMTAEDIGGVKLPPEDLASLGSKRIADPESLKVFSSLKSRAFSFLDRHGVRFMSGWAIPEEKAGIVVQELISIRDEFQTAKQEYLTKYDQSILTWINKHQQWKEIIQNSTVSSEYVNARMSFKWQIFKVEPLMQNENEMAVLESGLAEEVTGLGSTLFSEIARAADDMWKKVYQGKTEVTHRALSPLKTLLGKLQGLSFVEPHIAPVAESIESILNKIPKRGNIDGSDLVMLQGLVCLLKDSNALAEHAHNVLLGASGSDQILNSVIQTSSTFDEVRVESLNEGTKSGEEGNPVHYPEVQNSVLEIPSLGLW